MSPNHTFNRNHPSAYSVQLWHSTFPYVITQAEMVIEIAKKGARSIIMVEKGEETWPRIVINTGSLRRPREEKGQQKESDGF